MVLINVGSSDMDMILLSGMSLLTEVLIDIIVSIYTYIRVTYHIEFAIATLKYLPLATFSLDSINFTSIVLFY